MHTKDEMITLLKSGDASAWNDLRNPKSFQKPDLTDARLKSVHLRGFDLSGVDLTNAQLQNANLYKINLAGACLRGANLRNAHLREANLEGADLRDAILTDANCREANLSNATLAGATLYSTNFVEADLSAALLTRCRGRWADFQDANLTIADLREADLQSAIFTRARMKWADLRDADLRNTLFERADIFGAKLTGALLTDADLRVESWDLVELMDTVLDPENLTDPVDTALALSKEGISGSANGVLVGYRINSQPVMMGPRYEVGRTYRAPVFSTDKATDCHPGLYFTTLTDALHLREGNAQNDSRVIRIVTHIKDVVATKNGKFRTRKFRVVAQI